jgi:hypothetical protein
MEWAASWVTGAAGGLANILRKAEVFAGRPPPVGVAGYDEDWRGSTVATVADGRHR